MSAKVGLSWIFLCGDVMTGRGIDQLFPRHCTPQLYEGWVKDARDYVALAESANGPIPRPVGADYVWGDALAELRARQPALRLINLETSVTAGGHPWPEKGIHYRMHPDNVACLQAAGIQACTLANNHVLDWGYQGLSDTLKHLEAAGLTVFGAGLDAVRARRPARVPLSPGGQLLMLGCGETGSGIPAQWSAAPSRPGVYLLEDLSLATVDQIAERIEAAREDGDRVLLSLHWGGNWGYRIPESHRVFAHALIDRAGVDLVHGHSSHHPTGMEVYNGKLVLYGCGDFLNDYEGIRGYEAYRGDLVLMYFVALSATGDVAHLRLVPMQLARCRLNRASAADARWLTERLNRTCQALGTSFVLDSNGEIRLVAG